MVGGCMEKEKGEIGKMEEVQGRRGEMFSSGELGRRVVVGRKRIIGTKPPRILMRTGRRTF